MATCVRSPESLCRRKEKIPSTKFETDKWGQWCDLKLASLGFILVCETGSPIAQPSLELTTWLGWPWTPDLSLSTSQVLVLQACTTTADLRVTKGRTQGFVFAKLGKHFWLSHVPSSSFSFDLEFKINGPFYDQAGLLLWAWPPYTRFSNTNQPGKSDPFLQCLRLATFPPNYNNYTMTQTPMGLWSSFYHSWKASWAPRWLNQTPSFMESFFLWPMVRKMPNTVVLEMRGKCWRESWLDPSPSCSFSSLWTCSPSHGPIAPCFRRLPQPTFPLLGCLLCSPLKRAGWRWLEAAGWFIALQGLH